MTTAHSELAEALQRIPPEIPSHYGYDATGSELYAAIMQLPDYYLPTAETSLLAQHGADIMSAADPTALIDLGAGTAEKTEHLLAAASAPLHVTLLNVDPTIIAAAATRLRVRFPQHTYSCHQGFFAHARPSTRPEARTLIAFLGSTVGNLTQDHRASLYRTLVATCRPGDSLLITADLHDNPSRIAAAYQCGYTTHDNVRAKFALNRLESLNRTWNANFHTELFSPVPITTNRPETSSPTSAVQPGKKSS